MSYTAANEWCAEAPEEPSDSAVPARKIQTLCFIERPPRKYRSARVRDAIDDVAVVVAQQQRAVVHRGHIGRPAPRLAIRRYEADEEIDVLARGHAILD